MIDSADGNEKPKNKTQDSSSKTPVLDNFSRDLIKKITIYLIFFL